MATSKMSNILKLVKLKMLFSMVKISNMNLGKVYHFKLIKKINQDRALRSAEVFPIRPAGQQLATK